MLALKNVPGCLAVHFSFANKVLRISHEKKTKTKNMESNQIMKGLFFDDINMTFKIN